MTIHRYMPLLVERTPAYSAAPTLTPIDEIIVHDQLSWSTELLTDGGSITFAANPDQQSQDVKDVLLDIASVACEVWLYRDDVRVQAGPVIGVQTQGSTINIICRALGYYTRYMYITTDLVYDNVDQYTIGKGLVDHWQALNYGDYGIDTSAIGSSFQNRSISYIADEAPNVYSKLWELAQNSAGFEWYIKPDSRELVFTTRRGSDKSADVILDPRAVVRPSTHFSVAAGDYANHILATGSTTEGGDPVLGQAYDTAAMAKFGRAGLAQAIDEVESASAAIQYAQTLLGAHYQVHFIPQIGTIWPVLGAEVDDYDVGDTVTWVYNYGLGTFRTTRDVTKRFVSVSRMGEESMSVEMISPTPAECS